MWHLLRMPLPALCCLTECPSRIAQQIDSEYQPPKQPKAMPDSQKKSTILLVASCTSIAAIVLLWLLQRCTIQLHTEEAASSESTAGVLGKVLTFECRV